INQCPATDADLRPGDIIEKVNGIVIKNVDHLSILIENLDGKELELEIKRGNMLLQRYIRPIKNSNDGKLRLGLWVRDSTAGVGTLTFVNPENNIFAAVGHAITDVDTGALLSVKDGEIMQAKIVDIVEGRKGQPGEIKGIFSEEQKKIGIIKKNTPYGLFGKLYGDTRHFEQREMLPICRQSDVKLGEAEILSTIDNEGIKAYTVNII